MNKKFAEVEKFFDRATEAVDNDLDAALIVACVTDDEVIGGSMGNPSRLLFAIRNAIKLNIRKLSAFEIRDIYIKYLPIIDETIKHAEDRWERLFDDEFNDEVESQDCTNYKVSEESVDVSLLQKLLEESGYSSNQQ